RVFRHELARWVGGGCCAWSVGHRRAPRKRRTCRPERFRGCATEKSALPNARTEAEQKCLITGRAGGGAMDFMCVLPNRFCFDQGRELILHCLAMKRLASVRFRLAGMVFLAVAPALLILHFAGSKSSWVGFLIGLLALAAAWVGGELFILRQVRALLAAVRGFASGNLSARTGKGDDKSELGELARSFDVLAAVGQFALVASDLPALFNQVVLLLAQTLDVQYVKVMELQPDARTLLMR